MSRRSCLNCGQTLTGPWCAACGQKGDVGRLTLAGLLHEIPHGVFHVDRGFVPTLRAVFTRPATVAFDYLDGRRIRWFNPLTLVVLCAGVCGAAWALFPFRPELFWPLVSEPVARRMFGPLVPLWFTVVGATQLAFLVVNAFALYWAWKVALYWTRAREGLGPSRWTARFLYVFLPRESAALAADPRYRNYGEAIVASAFAVAPSLLLTAAAAPAFALAQTPRQYFWLIVVGAVLSCWPSLRLLATAPPEIRVGPIEATYNATSFAAGTPLGFALLVLFVGNADTVAAWLDARF
jgi:hypothetical protein